MKITIPALTKEQKISPLFYGVFIEDINYGCDGGLYSELVPNRAFENVNWMNEDCRLMRWAALENTDISIGEYGARHATNPHYLHVEGVGVRSEGYLGQGFYARKGEAYRATIIARGEEGSPLRIEFTAEDGTVVGESEHTLHETWVKYTIPVTVTGESCRAWLTLKTAGADFDYVSLMPVNTFKGRENGLRADIAQKIADLKPAFLRFPGGCIVEGRSYQNMYRFKETLGPVENRRTNWNRWQMDEYQKEGRKSRDYFQSYGMGFYEYFLFCEDIGASPLPILNCGLTCQWHEALTIPMDQMAGILQDYFDLIEFANGAADTPMGAIRAEMGHPEPFQLKMIGVGNEQWDEVYFERYEYIHKAVKEKHPEIELIAGAGWTDHGKDFDKAMEWFRKTETKPDYSDEHFYKRVSWFYENIHRYDHYTDETPAVFVGEYAAHADLRAGKKHNSLATCIAEAAFLPGAENAAAHVAMTCYAPLLARVGAFQWHPDLIWYDEKDCYGTANYHVQRMFSVNRGDYLLKAEVECLQGAPLYVTASWCEAGDVILKVVNAGAKAEKAAINLPGEAASMTATVLADEDLEAVNTIDDPHRIEPVKAEMALGGRQIEWIFPGQSVTVLRVKMA